MTTESPEWAVLDDDDARAIGEFADLSVDQIRGVEMLVLMKVGRVTPQTEKENPALGEPGGVSAATIAERSEVTGGDRDA